MNNPLTKILNDEDVEGLSGPWYIPADKLTIDEELGRGAFGTVYRGVYITTDVAVKKLHRADENTLKDFLHEVRIMKNLRHPNIVLWMGVQLGSNPGELSIVTEFVPNGTLFSYLQKTPDCAWTTRVEFALEIANALAYLHDRRILHRDLKSENVLLGPSLECKVADFGLAVLQKRSDLKLSAVGTPWWRAPEVDQNEYDERADIFSYGMVLAEIITRMNGEDIRLNITYQKKNKLEFGVDSKLLSKMITDSVPDCPPILRALAVRCCSEDSTERPTLKEVVEDLRKLKNELNLLDDALQRQIPESAEEGRKLFLSIAMGSFNDFESCTVKTRQVVDAVAKLIAAKTDRVLKEEEIAYLAEMIPNRGVDEVTLPQFASFWNWFSAIYKLITDTRLQGLWRAGFIHGFISRPLTEKFLEDQDEPQTVIFRFSSTVPDNLVLSYLSQKGGKVQHDLIKVADEGLITKNELLGKSLRKVLKETEPEYRNLQYIYPRFSLANAVFFDMSEQMNATVGASYNSQ
jgi:hypothetical protein